MTDKFGRKNEQTNERIVGNHSTTKIRLKVVHYGGNENNENDRHWLTRGVLVRTLGALS